MNTCLMNYFSLKEQDIFASSLILRFSINQSNSIRAFAYNKRESGEPTFLAEDSEAPERLNESASLLGLLKVAPLLWLEVGREDAVGGGRGAAPTPFSAFPLSIDAAFLRGVE